MKLTFQLTHRREEPRSTLGDIVREAYRFAYEGNYKPNHQVISPADAGQVMNARDFFNPLNKRYHDSFIVKQERLPFDSNICAVILRHGEVEVETARVDMEKLVEELSAAGAAAYMKGVSAWYDQARIIKSKTQNTKMNGVDRHTLWHVQARYETEELEAAYELFDVLDNQSCFKPDYIPEELQGAEAQKVELRQEQRLQQEMRLLQVPKLAVLMRLSPDMIQHKKILQMNAAEVRSHVKNAVDTNPLLRIIERKS